MVTFFQKLRSYSISKYVAVLIAIAVAITLSQSLRSVTQTAPYLLMWPVVIISSWRGGVAPGLLAIFLAVLTANYYIQEPLYSFSFDTTELLQGIIFTGLSVFLTWFFERARHREHTTQQQSEWLQTMLTSIGDGVIATDVNGKILLINTAAVELTGWQVHEAAKKDIAEVFKIVNEYTGEPVTIPVIEAIKNGRVVGLANHTILITKSGARIPISDSGAPIRDNKGEIIGGILTFRDVEEQRIAEAALQTSESQYRALVEGASDIIFTLDVDGKITSINQAVETVLGYSRDELLQTSISALVVAEQQDQALALLAEQMHHGEPTRYVLDVNGKDQRLHTLEFNSRVEKQGNTTIGIYGIARDISIRKQAEFLNGLLQKFVIDLTGAISTDHICQVIIKTAVQAVGGTYSGVFSLTEDRTALTRVGMIDFDTEYIREHPTVPIDGKSPLADAVQSRSIILVESQQEYLQRYPAYATEIKRYNAHAIICLPFWGATQLTGAMYITFQHPRKISPEEINILFVMAQACGQALERANLTEKAQENAATQERQRLANDLHDSVTQTLFSATIITESLLHLWERNPEQARERTQQVVTLNRGALAEMRTLLFELRPEAIQRSKLSDLLKQLTDAAQGRKSLQVELNLEDSPDELPVHVQTALYRIAQEGINNVIKHSEATHIRLGLLQEENTVTFYVHDNGRGFDPQQMFSGLGQTTMRDRASSINATLTIESEPEKGTRVTVIWKSEPSPEPTLD